MRVEAINNVYFDISNANFTITAATSGFAFDNPAATTVTCGTAASASTSLGTVALGGFTTPINLSATGNPAGTSVSFSPNPLTPGNSTIVSLNNTNTLASGTYTITVTGTGGAATQTRNLTFTITPTAPPAITTQPNDATICSGSNTSFTANSSTSGVTYQWQISTDGGTTWTNITGANAPTYALTNVPASSNSNRYRVVIATQCGTVNSNAATLTVNAPTAITSQPASATLCSGTNTTFTTTATGNNVSYQWQVSTNSGVTWTNIAGATSASYALNNVSTSLSGNQYRVIITVTSGGCPGSVTSNVANLIVNQNPTVIANASETTVCVGTPVTLTATGANTYSWTPGNLSGGTVNVNPTLNPNNPGIPQTTTYTVTGTTAAGCSNTSIVNVTANPLPVVTLTNNPNITSLFPGLSTTITANVTPPSPATTYQWYLNGQAINGANNSSILVDIDGLGIYSCVTTIGGACSSTSSSLKITDSASNILFIYPNPNKGSFQVRFNDKLNGEGYPVSIIIYDSKGARVYRKQFDPGATFGRMDVDLRSFASGTYFVDLIDAAGVRLKTGRVVINP
jgi:hypothetical protein